MAARTLRPASAADVRAFLLVEHGIKTGSRGRLSAEHIALFNDAQKRKGFVYTVGHKDETPETVEVETVDKSNRKRVRKVQVTTSAVRTFAESNGLPVGKRGVVSREAKVAYARSVLDSQAAAKAAKVAAKADAPTV